jgi:hypothetical protein
MCGGLSLDQKELSIGTQHILTRDLLLTLILLKPPPDELILHISPIVFFFGVLTLTLLVLRFLRFFFLNVLFFCKCPMVVKLFIIFSNNPYIKHFLLLICFPFRACFGYQSINWK